MSQTASTTGASAGATAASAKSSTIKKTGNVSTFSTNLTATNTFGEEFKAPDFTIKDILAAIPAHCYERRMLESFYYVARDIFWMVVIGYVGNVYIPTLPNVYLRGAAWTAYCIVQGMFGMGLWTMAHECGHQAFSDSRLVNDAVGWVLHSYWLVPYFSWKFSHGKHHKATGHMTRDMAYVPKTKEEFIEARHGLSVEEMVSDSPIMTLWGLFLQQFAGWFMYLFANISGQKVSDTAWGMSHFNPSSVLFEKEQYWYILLSDIGIFTQLFVLYTWYKNYGAFNVTVNWVLPYLGVNHWLIFITYLQHTDPRMPHYEAEQWTFARGAAATIDREFGFIGQHLFHDLIETHVLHHYCSRIPFYNAREASAAIQKVMGTHYQHTDENMWVSLWNSARWCQFVDGDNGVLMFRNINGKGVSPLKSA